MRSAPAGPGRRPPPTASLGHLALIAGAQRNFESRPALRRALRTHLAAVAFDDRLDDPQAEAQSARFRLLLRTAIEAIEHRAALDLRHAGAFIFDPYDNAPFAMRCANAHDAVLRGELAGVRQQVDEHLGKSRTIAIDEQQNLGNLLLQTLLPLLHQRADQRIIILDGFFDGNALTAVLEAPGLDVHVLE